MSCKTNKNIIVGCEVWGKELRMDYKENHSRACGDPSALHLNFLVYRSKNCPMFSTILDIISLVLNTFDGCIMVTL